MGAKMLMDSGTTIKSASILVKHKINAASHVTLKIQSDGLYGFSTQIKSSRNVTLNGAIFPSFRDSQFGWGLSVKCDV